MELLWLFWRLSLFGFLFRWHRKVTSKSSRTRPQPKRSDAGKVFIDLSRHGIFRGGFLGSAVFDFGLDLGPSQHSEDDRAADDVAGQDWAEKSEDCLARG